MSGRGKKFRRQASERSPQKREVVTTDAETETDDRGLLSRDYIAARKYERRLASPKRLLRRLPEEAMRAQVVSEEAATCRVLRAHYNALRSVVAVLAGYAAEIIHEETTSRAFVGDLEDVCRQQLAVHAAHARGVLTHAAARAPRDAAVGDLAARIHKLSETQRLIC